VMYERFTDRARRVMQLANQEAQRCNHEFIGTEHILLGLIGEGSGVAAHVLKSLNIDLHTIRQEVVKIVRPGPERVTTGKLPQTPRAKKVIEFAIEEARGLNHNYVGTEHVLLGLLREEEGVSAQVLVNLGLTLQAVRDEVLQTVGQPKSVEAPLRWRGGRPAKEYKVYLPLQYSNGTLIEPEKTASVEKRLLDHFGEVYGVRLTEERTWQYLGVTFRGKVRVLRVVAEPQVEVHKFFEQLVKDLKTELRQEDILIVVRDIEIL
jgi:ATP-dependent Clp protease ATP-binding subunit ClpA